MSVPFFMRLFVVMLPTISILGRNISTYSIMALLGIAFAVLLVWFMTRKRRDFDRVEIINIPAVAAVGAFLGAHILYGITHLDRLWWRICNTSRVFESWRSALFYFMDIFGGMVFYGGLIGGMLAGSLYCKRRKLDTSLYADILAPAIPLFHAFGRVGCFLGGCCYGIESSWGFVYENSPAVEANGVTRLPIQLFESAGNLIIVATLVILSYKKVGRGILFPIYLVMYGILRIITEFFRGDEIRGFLFGISTSQWISAGLIIAASVAIVMSRHKKERNI